LQAKRISIKKDMGLSEMGESAQLAREMPPRGYWNPAPMTVTVI
jgi:hypothetical protein